MKRSISYVAFSLALILLIFSCTLTISLYQNQKVRELKVLCDELPEELSDNREIFTKISVIEEKLKKAGTSLAFFTHYEQLNEANLACAQLRSAAEGRSADRYALALVELKEALGTLSRNDSFSLEVII